MPKDGKIVLENGIYYMISDGEKIPIDIDAPPKFRAIIDEVLKEARWIIAQDWKEKIVEHTTPSGQKRKVKIKSLSPEEQEKYKPKKKPGFFHKLKEKVKRDFQISNLENKKDTINEELDDKGFEVYDNGSIYYEGLKLVDKGEFKDSDEVEKKLKDSDKFKDFQEYKNKILEVDRGINELEKAAIMEQLVNEILKISKKKKLNISIPVIEEYLSPMMGIKTKAKFLRITVDLNDIADILEKKYKADRGRTEIQQSSGNKIVFDL